MAVATAELRPPRLPRRTLRRSRLSLSRARTLPRPPRPSSRSSRPQGWRRLSPRLAGVVLGGRRRGRQRARLLLLLLPMLLQLPRRQQQQQQRPKRPPLQRPQPRLPSPPWRGRGGRVCSAPRRPWRKKRRAREGASCACASWARAASRPAATGPRRCARAWRCRPGRLELGQRRRPLPLPLPPLPRNKSKALPNAIFFLSFFLVLAAAIVTHTHTKGIYASISLITLLKR